MQKQLNHQEFKHRQKVRKNNIIFVLENLQHMENIGSALRIADGFNIDSVIIVSKETLDFRKIKKISRNCNNTIKYKIVCSDDEALEILKQKHFTPINLEITSSSVPLREVDFARLDRVALIVGNENHGISDEMLSKVPLSVHIDLYGNNSSLNVATALAIAVYHVSESFKK